MVIIMFKLEMHFCIRKIALLLVAIYCTSVMAGPLNTDLDSSSRRSIQEAKMHKYGQNTDQDNNAIADFQNKDVNQFRQHAVEIVNTGGSRMFKGEEKRCDIKVGNIITNTKMSGTRQQTVTVVEGNVVNVCQ
jgi:hypothetical protein